MSVDDAPGAALPAEVAEAARAGRLIEAIKLLREQRGMGLAEAKAAVEAYLDGAAGAPASKRPMAGDDPGGALPARALAALQAGRMIDAVRAVREARGIGLKEAKDAVDAHLAAHPALAARVEAGRAEARARLLPWLWAILAVLALAAWLALRP